MSKDSGQEFAYLPPPRQELDDSYREEGLREKMIRKIKENPFVPMGVALTTFALTYGLWQFKSGNAQTSQKMMRLRIGGQGATVVAVLFGVVYGGRSKAPSLAK